MSYNAWIGVDLDGTLARYDGWVSEEHIGEPVMPMLERVRTWLAEGREVRIFTARVDGGLAALAAGDEHGELFRDIERIRGIVQDWTEKHLGVRLPVTNQKDYGMVELWDDRAVRIVANTGNACCDDGLPTLNIERLESLAMQKAMAKHHGNKTHAARELGIALRTLQRKLDRMPAMSQ